MVAAADQMIGVGIYSPAEAARLLKVRPQLVGRWLYGDKAHKQVLRPYFLDPSQPQDRVVTFWDLVQMLAVREARRHNVSLDAIRKGVERARGQMNAGFPLARRHAMFFFDGSLWVTAPGAEKNIIGIAGKDYRQLASTKLAEPFLEEIQYGPDGNADAWVPKRRGKYHVLVHRNRRFGAPMLMPFGLGVGAIVQAVESEGSVAAGAKAHEIPAAAMQFALDFAREHGMVAASA